MRGKCILRISVSPRTIAPIAVPVASAKNWKSMIPSSSSSGKSLIPPP